MGSWKKIGVFVCCAALATAVLVVIDRDRPAVAAQDEKGGGSPRYTVVETQGHNMIVTDNRTNILYFYTIDKDKQVGDPLRLRGTIDLNLVGKDEIAPVKSKHFKKREKE
jgi:hypothetical protein